MAVKQPKPVDMIALDPVRIESSDGAATVVGAGTIITGCDAELATILAASGKARVATADEIAEARKPKREQKSE